MKYITGAILLVFALVLQACGGGSSGSGDSASGIQPAAISRDLAPLWDMATDWESNAIPIDSYTFSGFTTFHPRTIKLVKLTGTNSSNGNEYSGSWLRLVLIQPDGVQSFVPIYTRFLTKGDADDFYDYGLQPSPTSDTCTGSALPLEAPPMGETIDQEISLCFSAYSDDVRVRFQANSDLVYTFVRDTGLTVGGEPVVSVTFKRNTSNQFELVSASIQKTYLGGTSIEIVNLSAYGY